MYESYRITNESDVQWLEKVAYFVVVSIREVEYERFDSKTIRAFWKL